VSLPDQKRTIKHSYKKETHKRAYLDQQIASYPELFPAEISNGYWLHGAVRSKKLNLMTRRIKLTANGAVYQVRPDFALPNKGWQN
jgi:hypothetical protein